ncbi:MAG TPA: serine/threonine-protein kinase [Labilithrix sp.]|nr:serine/threonine-protein kinase [Labilithrix sp.]
MTDLEELEQHAQRAREAREALVGKTIAGRYVLRGLLGHGGMGAVYEAEHLGLGKRVAIKFVDPEFATDEKVVARFAREARAMSAIESAHIVTVFDAGTEDGRPYLVMELLRGEDLGQRLRRLRRVALPEAMHIIAQVLKGLARAHAAGIIHRDLKPDNVFLLKHDTDPVFAKIVDFGISKIERPRANTSPLALTGRGTVLGTPFYMSPERAQAASDVDGRTDLYSVGAILFECLTGRPPHTGESYEQIILSICMREAPSVRVYDPEIPEAVSAFVTRALSRDRTQRFTTAERMLAALHEVAPEERARVPLDPPPAETLLSSGARAPDATILDGAVIARGSRPSDEISAVTRLGLGSLDDTSPEVREEKATRPEGLKKMAQEAVAKADARAVASTSPPPKAKGDKSAPREKGRGAAPPAPKPIGAALITAAVATLLGVGVTFGVITVLDKRAVTEAAQPLATSDAGARGAPSASAETTTATLPSAAPSASTSASPPPSAAPSASASGRAPSPSGRPLPPLPRPSARPLDIQRDLP